jgi:hypothetical protein
MLTVAACVLVALASAAVGFIQYAGAQADQRRDLRQSFAEDMSNAKVKAAAEKASAVRRQKLGDAHKLARKVKGLKAQAKRRAEAAYERGHSSGYASGNVTGYSSGHDDGYDDGSADGYVDGSFDGYDAGLDDGSDDLDCSDDPDVYWLPACY